MTNFKKGAKVWYRDGNDKLPAIVTGFGEKNGETVIDVAVENAADALDRNRWGYTDQITAR
jgi:hypothetical protein